MKLFKETSKNLNVKYQYECPQDFRELLKMCAKNYGDSSAFILKEKKANKEISYNHISFVQFKDKVSYLSAALIKKGLNKGPIAVIGKNSFNWMLVYFSTLSIGNIIVPLDRALPAGEAVSSLERSHSTTLFYDSETESIAEEAAKVFGDKVTLIHMDTMEEYLTLGKDAIEEGFNQHETCPINPAALSVILFTSGTTSMSKAVMLSQNNILINTFDCVSTEPIRHGDVNMAFLPYHHTFGATGQVVMIMAGVTTAYCDGLKYIQKNLMEYKVSIFVGVPLLIEAIYKKIIAGVKKQNKEKKLAFGIMLSKSLKKIGINKEREIFKDILEQLGGNLRFVISGASAIDPKVVEGLNNFGILAVQGYGLTESAPVIAAENPDNRRVGSVGKAMPNVEVSLFNVNEEGIGELIARGPNVMAGYFENPEESSKVLVDGWLHTGDLAYIDKDGYIFIKGREKNVIVLKNGKNIYPEEIETLIANLPFVEEVFVFGQEKGEGDLSVTAKIVYKADYLKEHAQAETHEEIQKIVENEIDKINDNLPAYKHIKRLILTDQPMIKTTTGKVKRFEEIKEL